MFILACLTILQLVVVGIDDTFMADDGYFTQYIPISLLRALGFDVHFEGSRVHIDGQLNVAINSHPLAIALQNFNTHAEGETRAFLVDVDGNNTEGMLVVDLYGFPTGILFYLHNGILHQADMGPQDAGFVSSMTIHGRRLVNLMADGGQWSYTLFDIRDNGDLNAAFTIFAEAFIEATDADQDGSTQHVFYMSDDFLQDFCRENWQSITFEEYDELRALYGLDSVRGAWWDMEDESAMILSKTLAPHND